MMKVEIWIELCAGDELQAGCSVFTVTTTGVGRKFSLSALLPAEITYQLFPFRLKNYFPAPFETKLRKIHYKIKVQLHNNSKGKILSTLLTRRIIIL